MAEHDQERSYQPTQRKRRDAQKSGHIARSKELNTFLIVISGAVLLYMLSGSVVNCFTDIMRASLSPKISSAIDLDFIKTTLTHVIYRVTLLFIPLFVLLMIMSILGPTLLGGYSFNLNNLAPKSERISLIAGIKRILSPHSIVELLIALLKFTVILGVAILVLWHQTSDILHLEKLPLITALEHGVRDFKIAIIIIASSLLLFSVIDVPYQLWTYYQKLRMTKQELKEETKNIEGNPETRQRIRQQQIELSQNRMIGLIKTANVIIFAPTQYAIAIQYNQNTANAPSVIAKGKNLMAEQILQLAQKQHIPIVRAPKLAQSLYRFTTLKQEIPSDLFTAVAKVLAYIYQNDRYLNGLAQKPVLPDITDIPEHLMDNDI